MPFAMLNPLVFLNMAASDWFSGDSTSCQSVKALHNGLFFTNPVLEISCLLEQAPSYVPNVDPLNDAGFPESAAAILILQGQDITPSYWSCQVGDLGLAYPKEKPDAITRTMAARPPAANRPPADGR